MRRGGWGASPIARVVAIVALLALTVTSRLVRADDAAPPKGMVVVAVDGATDVAWPLAARVYGSSVLRPAVIDDARARVLAGEPAKTGELGELAELRAGVKGDDAASREVLAALAQKLGVRTILVVLADPPSARLYDATTRSFDAARYAPDTSEAIRWDGAIRSLERPFLPPEALVTGSVGGAGRAIAVVKKSESKPFYESPWFWVAIGTAALIGGGVLIATSMQTSDTIHLQMRLP